MGINKKIIIFILATFLAVTSEVSIQGITLNLADAFSLSVSQIGLLTGVYAFASSISAIPFALFTANANKKHVFMTVIMGQTLGNLILATSNSFFWLFIGRIIGGLSAGLFWPMVVPYGLYFSVAGKQGRLVTLILSGGTLGSLLGVPFLTFIGNRYSWRLEFVVITLMALTIFLLAVKYLPNYVPQKSDRSFKAVLDGIKVLFANKGFILVLVMTLLAVTAHYVSYTYLDTIVDWKSVIGNISLVQLIFGVGTFLATIILARFIDSYLFRTILSVIISGLIAFGILLFPGSFVTYFSFCFWGISFGALSSLLQTIISKHIKGNHSIANSFQSSVFNFSIMLGSVIGGLTISEYAISSNIIVSIIGLVIMMLVVFMNKTYVSSK